MSRPHFEIPLQRGESLALPRPPGRTLRMVLMAAMWAGATLTSASPAQASADSYVANLTRLGIAVPGGEVELLEWGYEACALLEMGNDYENARAHAIYNSGSFPVYGLTVEQADTIMRYAISDLCNAPT